MKKYYLMAPGPTPVPSNVLLAMAQPMIHHRTPEYDALFSEVRAGLKRLFQTSQDVIPFTSSGTGAMEAAVVNTLSPGDTALLPGEVVEKALFEEENSHVLAEGGEPATAQVIVLGITASSLFTSSWLSAASFQHTTNVLTSAAVEGREDHLMGLKENVIIGRLIPTSPERAAIAT